MALMNLSPWKTRMTLTSQIYKMSSSENLEVTVTPSNFYFLTICLWKSCHFWERDWFWRHYLTVLKYHDFTLRTMKQPFHTNQLSSSGAVRLAVLLLVSFIIQEFFFNLLTLIETMYICYIVYFCCALWPHLFCLGALSVLLYWPALNRILLSCVSALLNKKSGEKRRKWT